MQYPRPYYLLQPQMVPVLAGRSRAIVGLGEAPPVAEDQELQTSYGIFGQPKALTAEYAPLEESLVKIIDEKVQNLPWIPADWFLRINQARSTYPEWRFILLPCLSIFGTRLSTAPAWLDTDDKLKVWNTIAKDMQNAIFLFSKQKVAEGQVILDQLYSNAAFWSTAYTIVKAVADAPGVFIEAAGDFATSMSGKFLKSFWPFLLVLGAGAVLYYGRKQIFSAAGNRVARSIR